MKRLYIIRGISGSGKTTLAHELCDAVCEADQFFVVNGKYQFNPKSLPDAHEFCKRKVDRYMTDRACVIAVANTFTQKWEYSPYVEMATKHGYTVTIIECHADHGNVHNVPEEAILRMKARWEPTV